MRISSGEIYPHNVPRPYRAQEAAARLEQWCELATGDTDSELAQWITGCAQQTHPGHALLMAVFGNSPYLSRLLLQFPSILRELLTAGAEACYVRIMQELRRPDAAGDQAALMHRLRIGKSKLALLIALADISGVWELQQVTDALSELAESSLKLATDLVLRHAHKIGEITLPHPEAPSKDSGIIILGMGKLGGHELNYSSDIDLIIFYEPGRLGYKGRHTEQHFMNRLTHELVTMMQERTPQGYVFRTDLRLRPDPASTPPAITTGAAGYYYESVGQNWERAAMIKARPVAGDLEAGQQFLKSILPFMWRRSLDFAAINDIHSIKRQMDSARSRIIQLAGHNIKLGMGGIREIEFYAQIHQLIWGGREPVLRTRATCDTLERLAHFGLITQERKRTLIEAYHYLRKLEHRLQMVADEQTHTLPESPESLEHIAFFMGYADLASFEQALLGILHEVHGIYASSFNDSGDGNSKLGSSGNLVFTGTVHDPETLKTLTGMGFSNPEMVSEMIMGWHHGSRRSTRTKRARELLTELMPQLLTALSETVNPDAALLKFHEFLYNLPAGVQLFSLFQANPHLLELIADIMGSAPTLAEHLSKNPELLDTVLYEDFYGPLPSPEDLRAQLKAALAVPMPLGADPFDESMHRLRYFRNEKHFQAGVQLLKHMITAHEAGAYLSELADVLLQDALALVREVFIKTYGEIPGSQFAVIGLGKLGSREMTFTSDIDLVFVYDVPDFESVSDGDKHFGPSVYFNRLAQRFVNALTAMGKGGRLYEVDTRLRPSGKQGLLAVSTKALSHYFEELAWTFESMAFTKARVIAGGRGLRAELDDFITAELRKPRDAQKLYADATDMRERIGKEFTGDDAWDIKYAHGGLIDIDFIAQVLLLHYGASTEGARAGSAPVILGWLEESGHLSAATAQELMAAEHFLSELFHILRLCSNGRFNEASAPPGLKTLLVETTKETDFSALQERLIQVEQTVHAHYIALLHSSPSA